MGVTPRWLKGVADSQAGSRTRSRARAWAIGVAALAGFGVILAACGGGSNTAASASAGSATTTAPANGNRTAQRQAFNQCMQSHGINTANLPRRGFGGGGGRNSDGGSSSTGPTSSVSLPPGVTQQQMQSALQACRSLLPTGGRNLQNNPAFAAYRNCLQLHGVTVGTGAGQGLDRTNPTVQSAMQACAALRPAPSSSTSTPPST
jgi:hypothetical protein